MSDKAIISRSGFLDLLEPGDSVMADKGFDIVYELMVQGVKLNIPPFVNRSTQLSKKKVITTRKIVSLRIHVERAIGRIKNYRILSNVVPLTLIKSVDDIWGVCCSLSLFQPPLVSDYVVSVDSDVDL